MTLEPLIHAPLAVQAHVAIGALVINGLNNVFFLPGITREVFFGP